MHSASCFGLQLLFRQSLEAPLLQAALEDAVTQLPWFAGRLVTRKGGRQFDVSCCNSGARLVIASTSATLEGVAARMGAGPTAQPASQRGTNGQDQAQHAATTAAAAVPVFIPYPPLKLPMSADVTVQRKLPLATVLLLQARGGGCLLAVSVCHAIADFESVQTFAAHLSAAYNRRLAAAAAAHSSHGGEGQLMPCGNGNPRAGAFFNHRWPEEVLAAAPPPPPQQQQQQPSSAAHVPPCPPGYAVVSLWQLAVLVFNLIREVLICGLQARVVRVPAARLEELKRRANAEVRADAKVEEGHVPAGGGEATGRAAGRQHVVAVVASTSASASDTAAADAADIGLGGGRGGDVAWVSARDALSARLVQIMHALPVRRQGPMVLLYIANMRGRLGPRRPHASTSSAPGSGMSAAARNAAASAAEGGGRSSAAGVKGTGGCGLEAAATATGPTEGRQGRAAPGAEALEQQQQQQLLPLNQLGNLPLAAWMELPSPSGERLGRLAARIRHGINHHFVPQFRAMLAHTAGLLAAPGCDVRRMFVHPVVGWRRRRECVLAPEGPLVINHWMVRHELWQFGPEPAVALLPMGNDLVPNLIITVQLAAAAAAAVAAAAAAVAAAGGSSSNSSSGSRSGSSGIGIGIGSSSGGDLVMLATLHKLVWRQLDAATGGDLAAAL
ncbi:hypothetical protein HYH02_010358 [Chlamydomonas schloesseri]|uniref:Uncharacterized protein n=1 Tax=Chlamydomonas schloesseri TaxID=2026947 RepID=A0A835THJ8_9CHLO|nr:hypothetical protein HYH02_010358 [Chlamydomonas schloesseri]|eukprot:KAG2440479.1 hypothetical protein HYH02_010358 [Chlamydomonas schloesseri]